MFSLFSRLIPFFNEGVAGSVVAPCLIGAGGFILALITYSQFSQVRKTLNTVFLDKKFMFFQLYVCFFLGSASIYGLCGKWQSSWGPVDICLIIINVCLFLVNFYTLKVKITNSEAAKKAGMSEAEYYDKVIAPSLAFRAN